MHNHEIIESYAGLRGDLIEAGELLHKKLTTALHLSGVKVHTVSQRVKTEHSLRNKISRPDKIYDSIEQLTDLIGLRVVTYFEDSVEEVARIVEEAFVIDFDRSIDKRFRIDPSSFGYRSLHYVCHSTSESLGLPFEIQIRTVLQHAWAEIEHDLGYKFPETVPNAIKRRFSRVAGLLEIADAEFVELRESMKRYEINVKDHEFQPSYADSMDAVVLKTLAESALVEQYDQSLAQALEKPLGTVIFFPDYLIRMLHAVNLHSSADIVSMLKTKGQHLGSFMQRYFEFTRETWDFDGQDFDTFQKAYSLFLLAHWRALELARHDADPLQRLQNFYGKLDYPQNETEASRVAELFYTFFGSWHPSP
ncbi:MAG: hypothetical protein H7249_09850 [Chitinophagaceae bacterium]|nr:hypothetical protein [Oligoflexus sp.]